MFRQVLSKLTSGNLISSSPFQNVKFMSTKYTGSPGLDLETRDQVLYAKINRPERYNAIDIKTYETLTETFKQVNNDKSIKVVVVTGTGEYYSSGNDLTNFSVFFKDPKGALAGFERSKDILLNFIDSMINCNKLMIAGVNGHAIGIAVSTIPLFDYAIASDTATFSTPFTALGQCPEACSSYTFPQLFGTTRASELLLLNMKWDANKAHRYGLVSELVAKPKFEEHMEELLHGKKGIVKTCYPDSLSVSRSLVRTKFVKDKLLEANRMEADAIYKCWTGPECADAVAKFFKKKN